jgi:hypothetical protein
MSKLATRGSNLGSLRDALPWLAWLGGAIVLASVTSCGGGRDGSSPPEGQDAAGPKPCPVTITIPASGEHVGRSINISVTESMAVGCEPTTQLTAYIDGDACDVSPYPYPNAGCKVSGTGSPNTLNFSQSTWVQVTPSVLHTLYVKSSAARGDTSTSRPVTFTYTPGNDGGVHEGGAHEGGAHEGGAHDGEAGDAGRRDGAVTADPVLIGAGDIGNYSPTTSEKNTGIALDNLVNENPGALVFSLGDNAYGPGGASPDDCDQGGSSNDFRVAFTSTLWGSPAILARMLPMPGNHEFNNCDLGTCVYSKCASPAFATGADWVMAGYWAYFNGRTAVSPGGGTAETLHYSTDFTTTGGKKWHYVSVNSGMCLYAKTMCQTGSSEYTWLQQDLAAHTKPTYAGIIVATHIDPWDSAGCPGGNGQMFDMFDLAYESKVDIFLDGHIHGYERFTNLGRSTACTTETAPGCPSSFCGPSADPSGPTVITIGSGGASLSGIAAHPLPNSQKQINGFGLGLLRLHDATWDFTFYQTDTTGNSTVEDSVTAVPVH